jgi:uncharacterized protein involved in exopolysaccharide biosynthesis
MDLAQILKELWSRRGWLAVGLVVALFAGLATAYEIGVLPPSLEKKALSIGVADTQILIDSPDSSLADLGRDLEPLAKRAGVYARFMTTRPVRRAIAAEVGLRDDQIITETPLLSQVPKAAKEPANAERSRKLLGEDNAYRLRFTTDSGLPTITIYAQAPRVEDAERLANAGATGFANYVRQVQQRQLGAAQGGVLAEEINRPLAALTFAGVFIGWCLLVLLVGNVSRSMRELSEAEDRERPVSGGAA